MKVSTRFAGLAATAGIFLLLVFKISLKVATAAVSIHRDNITLDKLKNGNREHPIPNRQSIRRH